MARPARINRHDVLRAALDVADEGGLDAVSMQRVAARLDVSTMALYRHVVSKSEVLDGLVEVLLSEVELVAAPAPWGVRLDRMGASLREVAARHPAAFPLLQQRPVVTAEARRVRDAVRDVLADAGIPAADLARAERLVSTAALGFCVSEVAGRFPLSRAERDEDFAVLQRAVRAAVEAAARRDRTDARTTADRPTR